MSLAVPAMLFVFASWMLGARSSDPASSSESSEDPTEPLRSLAASVPSSPARAALDEALSGVSADAGSAYGTPGQLAALEAIARGPGTMVAVSQSAPSSAGPRGEGESVARVGLEPSSPTPSSAALGPIESALAPSVSREAAARQLHAYVMRTSSASRDRALIRSLQTAMGEVRVDGLIGRETAARIRALTGLRIPGLS